MVLTRSRLLCSNGGSGCGGERAMVGEVVGVSKVVEKGRGRNRMCGLAGRGELLDGIQWRASQ